MLLVYSLACHLQMINQWKIDLKICLDNGGTIYAPLVQIIYVDINGVFEIVEK